MNIADKKTAIWIAIAALWLVCIVAGTKGSFVFGMCMGVLLMFLHMMLGVAKKGVICKKFLLYPMVIWAVLWIVSFLLSGYYAAAFAGAVPSFTFLGFHPSFAPTVFLYWIGGQLTLNLGFYLLRDEWLAPGEWDEFCAKAHAVREAK